MCHQGIKNPRGPGETTGTIDVYKRQVKLRALLRVFAADSLIQEDVVLGKNVAMGSSVLSDLDQLGVGGVFHLIVGGDPDICGGNLRQVVRRCHMESS